MVAKHAGAREHLAEKQAALIEAAAELTQAETSFDESAAIAARSRVEVLKEFVAKLEVAAQQEAEAEHTATAEAYLTAAPKRWTDLGQTMGAAAARARDQIAALIETLRELYGTDETLQREARAAKLLALRFGLTAPAVARPLVPAAADLLGGVLDFLSRSPHRVPVFDVIVSASATPEERTAATWSALKRYIDRQGSTLPAEVRAIFAAAGVPEPAETSKARAMREQREADDREAGRQLARIVPARPRHVL